MIGGGATEAPASLGARIRGATGVAAFYLGEVCASFADDLGRSRRPRNAAALRMAFRHA